MTTLGNNTTNFFPSSATWDKKMRQVQNARKYIYIYGWCEHQIDEKLITHFTHQNINNNDSHEN